jgi:outer membrane protein
MKIKLYILLWCAPALLFSQLSLDSAVSIGLEQNLNIQVQRKNLEAANENFNPGMAGLYPSLSVGGSYNYSVGDFTQQLANEPTERTIEDAVSENYSADVTVNYTLFDGLGRINNYRKLGLQKDLSETQLRFTIENTLLQVYSSYFEVARLNGQLSVAKEAVVLSLDRFVRAKTAFEIGGGSRLDFLSAEVDLNTDSVALLNAEASFSKRLRTLSQVLNFPVDSTYTLDTTVVLQRITDYAALKQNALNNNAALIQAEYNRQISKKDIAIAWSDYAPNISASGGYQFSRQDNEGSFLQFTQNQGWQGGITARWTLFNGNRTKTQIELAKINLDRSTLEVEAAKQQLEVDLSNAWIDYENSLLIRKLEGRNLDVAKLNYTRSKEAYQLGQINNTQLREAQLNYINTKVRYKNLGFSLKIVEVELLRVGGLLLTE